MLSKQKLIGTYRNDKLRVIIKSYQVNTTGTNKPEFRDIWNEILDKMDPPPPWRKWISEDEDALTKLKTYVIPIGDTALVRQKAVARMHIDGVWQYGTEHAVI